MLTYYISKFKSLRCGNTKFGPAPHKPILLLAVICAVEHKIICQNRIAKDDLVPFFTALWELLVTTDHHCDIHAPFHFMESEGFWYINTKKDVAILDWELYQFLQTAKIRTAFAQILFATYFKGCDIHWDELTLFPTECIKSFNDDSKKLWTKKEIAVLEAIHFDQNPDEMLKKNDTDELDTIGLSNATLTYLKQELEIETIDDFLHLDIRKSFKQALMSVKHDLPQTRHIQQNLIRQMRLKTMTGQSSLSDLCIPPKILHHLHEANILTLNDFASYDMYGLMAIYASREKIHNMKKLQRQVRQVLSASLKEKSSNIILSNIERDCIFSTSYLNLPLECILTFDPETKTLQDCSFSPASWKNLRKNNFYAFDEIELLRSTSLEYFITRFGLDGFSCFWDDISKQFDITTHQFSIPRSLCGKNKFDELPLMPNIIKQQYLDYLHKWDIYNHSDLIDAVSKEQQLSCHFIILSWIFLETSPRIREIQEKWMDIREKGIKDTIFCPKDLRSWEIYIRKYDEKFTLERISLAYDISRERVRQIVKNIDNQIKLDDNDDFFPLSHKQAFYLYLEAFLFANRWHLTSGQLRECCSTYFNGESQFFKLTVRFLTANFSTVFFGDTVFLCDAPCLSCSKIAHAVLNLPSDNVRIHFNQMQEVVKTTCNDCAVNKMPCNWETFLPFYFFKNTEIWYFYDRDAQVFHRLKKPFLTTEDLRLFDVMWRDSNYSKIKDAALFKRKYTKDSLVALVESLFSKKRILSINELQEGLSKHDSRFTIHETKKMIKSAKLILADRGRYMLPTQLPSLPENLLLRIENEISEKLSCDFSITFSLNVIYKKFQDELIKHKCVSPYLLFEILKKENRPFNARFIKCPYITCTSNHNRFQVTHYLDEYISKNGRSLLKDIRQHFLDNFGISAHVLSLALQKSKHLITDDENYLRNINTLHLNQEDLSPFYQQLSNIKNDSTITAYQLYVDNKATCLLLDIIGPKFLYNILRYFFFENFSFRYPQISPKNCDIVPIKQMVIDFIRDSESFCTAQEICDFFAAKRINPGVISYPRSQYPMLFKYLAGAWVHSDTIGYQAKWLEQIVDVALEVLQMSTAPKHAYAFLDSVCEHEDRLPELGHGLYWTSELLSDMLLESKKFLIYGKGNAIYSLNKSIKNFGDLCALLLNEDFDGAANVHEFSLYLAEKGLLANRDLRISDIEKSELVTIHGQEVYTIRSNS